jgi:hypothetical protein
MVKVPSRPAMLAVLLAGVTVIGLGASSEAQAATGGMGSSFLGWKKWFTRSKSPRDLVGSRDSHDRQISVDSRQVAQLIVDDPATSYHYRISGTLDGKPVRFDIEKNRVEPQGPGGWPQRLFSPAGKEIALLSAASARPASSSTLGRTSPQDYVNRIYSPRRIKISQEDPARATFDIRDADTILPRSIIQKMKNVKVDVIRYTGAELPFMQLTRALGREFNVTPFNVTPADDAHLRELVEAWQRPDQRAVKLAALDFEPMTLRQAWDTLDRVHAYHNGSPEWEVRGLYIGEYRPGDSPQIWELKKSGDRGRAYRRVNMESWPAPGTLESTHFRLGGVGTPSGQPYLSGKSSPGEEKQTRRIQDVVPPAALKEDEIKHIRKYRRPYQTYGGKGWNGVYEGDIASLAGEALRRIHEMRLRPASAVRELSVPGGGFVWEIDYIVPMGKPVGYVQHFGRDTRFTHNEPSSTIVVTVRGDDVLNAEPTSEAAWTAWNSQR